MKKEIEIPQVEIKERKWTLSTATIISTVLSIVIVVFIAGELWSTQKTGIANNSADFKDVKLSQKLINNKMDSLAQEITMIKVGQKLTDIKLDNQNNKIDKQKDVLVDILSNVKFSKDLAIGIMSKLTSDKQDTVKKKFCYRVQK
jgi:hypothetical protein